MLQPEPPQGVGWSWWGDDAEGLMMLGRGGTMLAAALARGKGSKSKEGWAEARGST